MRRMITNKQVVDIVNKGIEEGEIEVGGGGLTPEQEEKLDNSLQLPESAPAAQQLVGINTSGEQNALGIGDGLIIKENNVKLNRITLNFNNQSYVNISEEDYNAIYNATVDYIEVLNGSNVPNGILIGKGNNGYGVLTNRLSVSKTASVSSISLKSFFITVSATSASQTGYRATITVNNDSATITQRTVLTGASGTGTCPSFTYGDASLQADAYFYQPTSGVTVFCPIVWCSAQTISSNDRWAVGEAKLYASDGTLTATYKIVFSGNNWTATAQ